MGLRRMRAWVVRLAGLFPSDAGERQLSEELESHLQMHIEDNIKAGMSAQEARRQALLRLGGVAQTTEAYRRQRTIPTIEEIWQDARSGVRMMRKSPGLTLIALTALALGIGANTAIFSAVNAVLLRPLQYADADRLIAVEELDEKGSPIQVTAANFLDWRAQSTVFAHLAAILERSANLATGEEPVRIDLAMTSADFFDVFGLRPELGRLFVPSDEQAGHEPVAVVSYGLWKDRFGGDPAMIGRSITLDGQPYSVIGVAPAGFGYPGRKDAWIPPWQRVPTLSPEMNLEGARGYGFLSVVGRLRPGASLTQAQMEMAAITGRLRVQHPQTNNTRFDRVVPLQRHLVGESRAALLLLLGAVALVLLIACANVAHLLLARAAAREKEIALRVAMGATRARLVRQLLVESVVLALTGGALGLLLGLWGVDLMRRLLPIDFPRAQSIGVDLPVLGFALLVSLTTGVAFGLVPALQSTNPDLNRSIKENTRGAAGGIRGHRTRTLLIVSETALSLVLLIGAGLLLRSFLSLQDVALGFRPERVLTFRVSPAGGNFREDAKYSAFYLQVAERIRALPGVDAVGAINTLPLVKGPTASFQIEGRPETTPDKWPGANYRSVTPGYFHALDVTIAQGREFSARDDASTPLVVIVNRALVQRNLKGEDPVGKRITFGGKGRDGKPIWFQIVGVVGDVRSLELRTEPAPEVYTSCLQDPFAGMSYVVRSRMGWESLVPAVRDVVRQTDPAQPMADVKGLETIVSDAAAQPRFNSLLVGVFAGLALLLAASGIYGVMSYAVTQRTHEIGVRMALGARGRDVLRLVVGQGLRFIVVGLALGLVFALALTRLMRTLLYGVGPTDLATFAGCAALLALVALLASYVPARRALRVDPLIALRYE